MTEIFLADKDDKWIFESKKWRYDGSYRVSFKHRDYSNCNEAKIMKKSTNEIFVFKNNAQITTNDQTHSMKFKKDDLIRIEKKIRND